MASPAAEAAQPQSNALPDQPATSATDDGLSRRPRDARLVHLILSSLGIHSYQERVPLQLLDFAYRYTSSVLSDSLRLSAEGYTAAPGQSTSKRAAAESSGAGDGGNITVAALRQAIASRQDYTFRGPLPKEFMLEQAAERNRTVLPKVDRSWGVQLPPERYCLTGTGWNLKEEWESEGEDGEDGEAGTDKAGLIDAKAQTNGDGDNSMGGMDGAEEEEGEGGFEDVFGEGEDKDMAEG